LTPASGGQDGSLQNENTIAVPPAPPIVASPATPTSPPIPQTPAAPPPFLVPPNPAPTGNTSGNVDNGAANTSNAPGTGTSATAPAPLPVAPGGAAPSGDQALDQDTIPTPPNIWQPGKVAEIGVLDKIDGEVAELSVPVGGQSVIGDLQVNVLACVTRPPDQVPDAAVFLALQSTGNPAGPPAYRGWLIRSEPGAAVAGDASETFRIIACS
jgi:hypothetical protein